MAKYIKNDINFHGARSKTRVAENPSSNKNFSSKNKEMAADGWGSVPSTSVNNNNDHGWGEVPSDGAIHKDTWENDRLVYGKSERNRKFRLGNDNSSFRVPIQSVPNWEEADTEFPSLGSNRSPPANNVWEKRKRKQEEVAAIAPSNETEEEMMIRQALELSMKESKKEEERRRQLEEEYRLQMEILEANPDMFNEFRADQNEFPSSAAGFDNHSQENFSEDFPSDEKVDYDRGAWGYSNKKTTKENPKAKTEDLRKLKDDFPQLISNSTLPSFNGTTQSKNKVSQAVEMFGGWGTVKPFTQSSVAAKPPSKPSKWDTVDTEFAPLPSKKAVVEGKPTVEPQTPPSQEVKLENSANWDSVDAKSSSEAIETRNNLGTRDAVELNLKDAEPGYALDQKEKEFESQTKRKKPKAKLGRRIKERENNAAPEEKTDTSVSKVERSTEVKGNDLVPGEDGSEASVPNGDQSLDVSCDRLSSEHNNQKNSSLEFQNIPQEKNAIGAGAESEFGLLKSEFPESNKSVECDYAFLLNQIEVTNTVTNSEDLILNPPVEMESTSKNSLPEIYQTTFNIDNFLTETTSSEVLPIPEPVPFSIDPPSATNPNSISANNRPNINSWNEPNSNDMFKMPNSFNDATPLRTFGGYPTNPESFNMAGDTSQTNLNEEPSLPTFGESHPIHNMPVADNGASQIRVPGPSPEIANPGFFMQPRPVLAPFMNPALMMNPLMMQPMNPMMMMGNPFFLQQLAQMDLYYKLMGMPVTPGIPTYPQPMPVPAFNAQNFQGFNPENMHEPCHNIASGPAEPNQPIPTPIQRPANQLPEPNQPENVPPPTAEQPAAEHFWFEDFMSSDPVIPPPVPTSTQIPVNPGNLPGAFSAMSLQGQENPAPNATNQGLSKESTNPERPTCVPSPSPVATGWGSIDGDARSETSSGWNDSVDGWGGSSDTTTRSMRNSSRYVSENRANCRQPTSRPNLRRPNS